MVNSTAYVDGRASIGKWSIDRRVHDHPREREDRRVDVDRHPFGDWQPITLAERRPLVVGAVATTRSHVTPYEGSTFRVRQGSGHPVTTRADLSGGSNVRVGTGSDLLGNSTIGYFVRLQSGGFACHPSTIGDFVWISVMTNLTDDQDPSTDFGLRGSRS